MKLLLYGTILFALGCQSLKLNCESGVCQKREKLKFSRVWAKDTKLSNNLSSKKFQQAKALIHDEYVFIGNAIDSITAFDKTTGTLIWSKYIKGGVESTATAVKNILYFSANDGFFYAVDIHTGKTKWSAPIRFEGLGAPIVSGQNVYFLTGNNVLIALDRFNGQQRWIYSRTESSELTIRGASKPAILNGKLYVGFSDGAAMAFNALTGAVIWEQNLATSLKYNDVDAKPLLLGGSLYLPNYDGHLYKLNPNNGQVIWKVDVGGPSTVGFNKDLLFVSTSDSKVVAVSPETGDIKWEYKVKKGIASTPVFHKGMIVFTESDADVVALEAHTGRKLATYTTGFGVSAPVNVTDQGHVYFISRDAILWNLKLVR
ncbi:MAG: PQQ-binding-like beta-propeller repeat protein [Bdellovibrionales bacterium]|nr:PQQ-binding-like beta-propeller repeat protein [Bdellovibrionales bacterium]